MDKIEIARELERGGEWLAEARGWMQRKIQGGDRLTWSSNQPVTVVFCDLEDFAKTVAVAAIAEERKRIKIRINAIRKERD